MHDVKGGRPPRSEESVPRGQPLVHTTRALPQREKKDKQPPDRLPPPPDGNGTQRLSRQSPGWRAPRLAACPDPGFPVTRTSQPGGSTPSFPVLPKPADNSNKPHLRRPCDGGTAVRNAWRRGVAGADAFGARRNKGAPPSRPRRARRGRVRGGPAGARGSTCTGDERTCPWQRRGTPSPCLPPPPRTLQSVQASNQDPGNSNSFAAINEQTPQSVFQS